MAEFPARPEIRSRIASRKRGYGVLTSGETALPPHTSISNGSMVAMNIATEGDIDRLGHGEPDHAGNRSDQLRARHDIETCRRKAESMDLRKIIMGGRCNDLAITGRDAFGGAPDLRRSFSRDQPMQHIAFGTMTAQGTAAAERFVVRMGRNDQNLAQGISFGSYRYVSGFGSVSSSCSLSHTDPSWHFTSISLSSTASTRPGSTFDGGAGPIATRHTGISPPAASQ